AKTLRNVSDSAASAVAGITSSRGEKNSAAQASDWPPILTHLRCHHRTLVPARLVITIGRLARDTPLAASKRAYLQRENR
ncbi:hypothetical protein ACET42_30780, partial [Pseudomonas aeruginosa]